MQTKHAAPSLVIAVALVAGCASTVLAQNGSPGGNNITLPGSSIFSAGDAGRRAHTNLQILGAPGTFGGTPQFYGPPYPGLFYETPASIACLYSLEAQVPGCNPNVVSVNPNGGKKAIAIVDAYDYPNAYSDLATFSGQFGVGAINPTSFVVIFAPHGSDTPGVCIGSATRPPVDPTGGWEIEEALDIEWAHAMAPGATLYLVEAQSNYDTDLLCAVSVASSLVHAAGGGEVSMSWGGGEFPFETVIDPLFTVGNVVYFASTGDSPGPSWPSVSPNIVSVGGSTISRNPITGDFINENDWQSAGGGPSVYEPRPAYQNSISGIVGSQRGTPDIALDANPYTGVWVLDNFLPPDGCTPECWYIVGGTSVSSPTLAGIVNAANSFAVSSNAELTQLYKDGGADFTDLKLGSCGPYMGYLASAGWDFCTGLGSPKSYKGK